LCSVIQERRELEMATAIDVLRYIKSRQSLYGEVQAQKLAYFVQAWGLVWTGKPVFSERIEAWKMGPVVPALRFRTADVSASPGSLSQDERAIVDAVLDHYGRHSGAALVELTPHQRPWVSVWEARGHDGDWCSTEIPLDLMRDFFTSESLQGRAPNAPVLGMGDGDDEDVSQIAAANVDRWADALILLGK